MATRGTAGSARGDRVERPTLTDVARVAGVSRQTASRVARGGDLVNEETARKVRRVIEEIGYQPNILARALSVGSARHLGMVTHTGVAYGTSSTMVSVEAAAKAAGYRVVVAHLSEFSAAAVQDAVDGLVRIGCDGILLMTPWASDAAALHRVASKVPVVTTSQVPGYEGPAAFVDSVAAAAHATRYLLGLGHRTVHHVAGPVGWNAALLREQGWRSALEEAGAPVPQPLRGDWTSQSGAAAGELLARDAAVTAVFAANDEMALGLLYSLQEAGRRVPEDVSVIGFDDAPGGAHLRPPLTTIRGDRVDHGQRAVAMLLAILKGEVVRMRQPVGFELVVRGSVAPRR